MAYAPILRHISCIVLVTFTSLTLQPLQAVAQQQLQKPKQVEIAVKSKDENYSDTLEAMKQTALAATGKHKQGKRDDDEVKQLRAHSKTLAALETGAEADFAATEAELKAKKLPAQILARHQAMVTEFKAKQSEFKRHLKAVEDADDKSDAEQRKASVTQLADYLKQQQKSATHRLANPKNLPFGQRGKDVREPKETTKDLKTALSSNASIAQQGDTTNNEAAHNDIVHDDGEVPVVSSRSPRSGFIKASTMLLAQATPAPAPTTPTANAPTAADLAETEDIVLTQPIKDLAASLDKSPVKIYNWVKSNIEFLPSYGSIQGADLTLATKRGNAFDTSSLLIALYRAAGIPSRYVYGTIELPIDQAMNWVGGVTKAEAAVALLAGGAIPSRGVVSQGRITSVKLEHVWVEAYVDYHPSRGAVNKTPTTWTPVDAAFKQYTYTQGMDLQGGVPFDANSLVTAAQQGATVNTTEGWVQNINQANIQSQLTSYQTQVQTYVNNQKANATVGDVLGTSKIVQQTSPILFGSLPYKQIATGERYSSLPSSLRHEYHFSLTGVLDPDTGVDGLRYSASLPSLARKKITLAFVPASQADADTIASYLPKPHADGSPIQPSELPRSLPGYLIQVKPELRVDGKAVATTNGAVIMGKELYATQGVTDPMRGADDGDFYPVAGEVHATAISGQGVAKDQLDNLKTKLTATQAKLQAKDFNSLNAENVMGDILYSTILTYFHALEVTGRTISSTANAVEYAAPSYGRFQTNVNSLYWFGLPKAVTFPGLTMDVQAFRNLATVKNMDSKQNAAYNQLRGMQSSEFEHLVTEAFWVDPNTTTKEEAVSAVKALSVAASQGQKIYTIDRTNIAAVLPTLQISQGVKDDITNSVNAGRTATVSEKNISQSGFTGVGYILSDPETGSAAYKIIGGSNGATTAKHILSIVSTVFLFTGTAAVSGFLLGLLAGLAVFVAYYALMAAASAILDQEGRCSERAATTFLSFFGPITFVTSVLGLVGGAQTVTALMFSLIAIMYGKDLFGGFPSSRVCQ
jgi:transglutaminase-like putative cysteine protease